MIDSHDDLKSKATWKSRGLEPFHHQVADFVNFCRRLRTLLADDVGLGKTVSAGLIASELISRKRLSTLLIVCPKLLDSQWREALESNLASRPGIAIGNKLLDMEPRDEFGAIIATYHSARLYLGRIPSGRFQMLVLENMARKGTIPQTLAIEVRAHVQRMPRSAKLTGLAALVGRLRKERPKVSSVLLAPFFLPERLRV